MAHSVHTAAHDGAVGRAGDETAFQDVTFGDVVSAMLAVAVTLMSVTIVLSWVAFSAR